MLDNFSSWFKCEFDGNRKELRDYLGKAKKFKTMVAVISFEYFGTKGEH